MQNRGARLAVVALLLAVGGAAAILLWDVDRRGRSLDAAGRDVAQRIDALTAALVDIGLTRPRYVALGTPETPVQANAGSRLRQFEIDAAALRERAASPQAARALEALAGEMTEVAEIHARAQQYAREGQTFLASDLLFGPVRTHLSAAGSHLRDLRAAETAARAAARAELRLELWSAIGAAAGVWAAGLLLLAWRGRTGLPAAGAPRSRAAQPVAPGGAGAPRDHPVPQAAAAPPAVDLGAAAALCTELSRVTTAAALPDLLARAADVLDARGLIVWMGAGDQLFAAVAHGYEARIVSRLAPIGRTAANATAAAWRTGRPGAVEGEAGANGAIVAPIFNPADCIGVLAAEVRHGRENDPSTRAVTLMIAAQLGAVIAAWPAASSGGGGTAARDRAAG